MILPCVTTCAKNGRSAQNSSPSADAAPAKIMVGRAGLVIVPVARARAKIGHIATPAAAITWLIIPKICAPKLYCASSLMDAR